ncbi:hypothetical protein J4463_03380 [Candidatus Pacearchaeota archaeon]|nr:hypothetical protein [Candidatus Pacearchaeota archaeon]
MRDTLEKNVQTDERTERRVPSDELWDEIIITSTPCIQCDNCGRYHYSKETLHQSKKGRAYLEDLKEKEKLHPERFVEHPLNVIVGKHAGEIFIYGDDCEKQDRLAEFEEELSDTREYFYGNYLICIKSIVTGLFLKARELADKYMDRHLNSQA